MPETPDATIDQPALLAKLDQELAKAQSAEALKQLRAHFLGKKGVIAEEFAKLKTLPAEAKKAHGDAVNSLRDQIEAQFSARAHAIEEQTRAEQYAKDALDLSLDVPSRPAGGLHPLTKVGNELDGIFAGMGFSRRVGPDIEDDFHNFESLNFPPDHPAREMHDTFYLDSEVVGKANLLRTHTSPVQIRTLLSEPPPLRIFAPGRTYRCDSDQTHAPMFHQIEGLVVDRHTHFGHLKGALSTFLQHFFETDAPIDMRFRPSYFPFTEPSAEVDIRMHRKNNKIVVGEGDDWLEILGCGMIHPNVLRAVGLDPNEYQGYAFGIGLERLAMLKYGTPDLRAFFDGDLNWLRANSFRPDSIRPHASEGHA